MRAATISKYFRMAVELENIFEPLAFHERPGFFAADAAGAKHDDSCSFNAGASWRTAAEIRRKWSMPTGQGILERAELDL